MIKYHNQEYINLTIDELKKKLYNLYKNNINLHALCYILLKNNKKMIMEQVINERITLEECILSSEYYVTYIDIYLLSKEYDLPIILLCNTIIDLTITKEKFIIFNLSSNNNYFFIKNRSLYDRNKLHNYKLLINAFSVTFNIDKDLKDSDEYKLLSKIEYAIDNYQDVLGNYIDNYSENNKKKKVKQVPVPVKVKTQKTKTKQDQVEAPVKEEAPLQEPVEAPVQAPLPLEEEAPVQAQVEAPLQAPLEEEAPVQEAKKVNQTKKIKLPRCPNGTRRVNMDCVKKI